ncbi:amidohydrolase family protein [Candidimonas nitroreducens]|uniref:amidohydrolase family protein n=1 Tax=Candidimonas nitroreducens TaxID=683354 RepID=UPI001303DF3E|nr:amidohydrolase family protein [Candidimonas nitroreducens]
MSTTKASQHAAGETTPYSAGTNRPSTELPPGATDCHHHIFDPRFPRANGRTGVWATVADYRKLQHRLGLSRSVVVCPGSYGFDNSALLDALAQMGSQARGVAAIEISTPDQTLASLNQAGVRGIRLYLDGANRRSPAQIQEFAARIAPWKWHIQILPDVSNGALEDCAATLDRLNCPIVLDHLSYIPQPEGLAHPRYQVVRRLLDNGRTWIKLSGVYITSKVGYPDYRDIDALATELATLYPDRVLWGTDWPHTLTPEVKPNGAELVDQLARWAPDDAARQKILVENPNEVYGWNIDNIA